MKQRTVANKKAEEIDFDFYSNLFGDGGGKFDNITTAGPWDESSKRTVQGIGSDSGSVAGAFAGTQGMLDAALSNAKLKSTYNIQAGIADNINLAYGNQNIKTNDDLMQAWDQYDPLDHVHRRDIRGGSTMGRIWNTNMASIKGAEAGWNASKNWIGAVVGGVVGLGAGVAGWITGGRKASRLRDKLNREIDIANAAGYQSLSNQTSDVAYKNLLRAEGNYVAYGGPLNKRLAGEQMRDVYSNGIPSYQYAEGGSLAEQLALRPQSRIQEILGIQQQENMLPIDEDDEGVLVFTDTPTEEEIKARQKYAAMLGNPSEDVEEDGGFPNTYAKGGNINVTLGDAPDPSQNTYKSYLSSVLPIIETFRDSRDKQEAMEERRRLAIEEADKKKDMQLFEKQLAEAYAKGIADEYEGTEGIVETRTVPSSPNYTMPSEELYQSLMQLEGFLEHPQWDVKGYAIGYGDHDEALNKYYLTHRNEKYTKEQGRGQMEKTVNWIRGILSKRIKNWYRLTGPQMDALTSYAYNTGPGGILNNKALMDAILAENWAGVAANMNADYYSKDPAKKGIKNRRDFERRAFLYPTMTKYGVIPEKKNILAYGNPPTKRRSERTTREKHLAELEALAKKYPELYGIKTRDFLPWLNETAFKESSFDRYNGNANYVGYYALPKKWFKTEDDWSSEAQFKNAFRHLKEIFHDKVTKDDLIRAKSMGITPAQLLFKYWNQGNATNNFLYKAEEGFDGNGTKVSQWGNDYNPNDPLDYSRYLQSANTAPYYILGKGDSYYTAARNTRNPYLNYRKLNYGVQDFPYNQKYPATQVGDTVALYNLPVSEFRKAAKKYDATHSYGGNLFKKGGKTKDPKKDYAYINNELTPWVYNNLKEFWGPQSSEVRQWLRKNYPEQLNEYYENTPEDIRRTIPNKYLTKEQQAQRGKNAASSAMDSFGREYLPHILLTAPSLALAPGATLGSIGGGKIGEYFDRKAGNDFPIYSLIGGIAGGGIGALGQRGVVLGANKLGSWYTKNVEQPYILSRGINKAVKNINKNEYFSSPEAAKNELINRTIEKYGTEYEIPDNLTVKFGSEARGGNGIVEAPNNPMELAHEFGHNVLKHNFVDFRENPEIFQLQEAEANNFAKDLFGQYFGEDAGLFDRYNLVGNPVKEINVGSKSTNYAEKPAIKITKKDPFIKKLEEVTNKTITKKPIKETNIGDTYSEGIGYYDESGNQIAHIAGNKRPGNIVFVESSYIDPAYRRQGLGAQMYKNFNEFIYDKYGTTLHSSPYQHMSTVETNPGSGVFISPSSKLWRAFKNKGEATIEGQGLNQYYVMAKPTKTDIQWDSALNKALEEGNTKTKKK